MVVAGGPQVETWGSCTCHMPARRVGPWGSCARPPMGWGSGGLMLCPPTGQRYRGLIHAHHQRGGDLGSYTCLPIGGKSEGLVYAY